MDKNGVRTHDVSQLVSSKYDSVISNDFSVELIGDQEISIKSETFDLGIRNGSDYMLYYGSMYVLEVLYNEEWYKVPYVEGVQWFTLVEFWLDAHSYRESGVGLVGYELYPGKYRIVKEFDVQIPEDENGEGRREEILVSFEFNLY